MAASLLTPLFLDRQPEHYSPADHRTWAALWQRLDPLWQRHANQKFLAGLETLALDPNEVPQLDRVNRFLSARTGFRARAVAGYVPAFVFFDCLRRREFPTTVTVRPPDRLDYLPEPDIFHDIAGHVPMHTDSAFAEALVRFGDCAHAAAEIARRKPERLASIVRGMSRFFWFTVEFGLMREQSGLKAYGSGLLSSAGELEHALTDPDVQRRPIQLEWVINQSFEIDRYQPLLFVIESFDRLYELTGELERWMKNGRLGNTAPGQPEISVEDLSSFLP